MRRSFTTWTSGLLVVATVATSILFSPPLSAEAAAGDPFRFIYDENGRLVAAVTPTDQARYTYDAVGNITAIARQAATVVRVIEFAPHRGAVGTAVTVYGTGFSTTPSQNMVKFNGVTAAVSSSTTTAIVTTVPAGATTGTINVTAPGGSATSTASFTVGTFAPTITGLSATVVDPGTSLTISGTRFETTATNNAVTLNTTYATVTAASPTSLTTVIPPASGSGPVVVRTPDGTATGADLFIAPLGFSASQVGATGRATVGQPAVLNFPVAGKIGLLLVDAPAGQHISLNMSQSGLSSYNTTIRGPDGTAFYGPVCCAQTYADTIAVPYTGTYTVVIEPFGTGSVTVTVSEAADVTAQLTANGPPVQLTTTVPGQNAVFTFLGTANQRVSVVLSSTGFPGGFYGYLKYPDGSNLWGPSTGQFVDTLVLPMTGIYSMLIDPPATSATGTVTAQLYEVPPDASGTLVAGGSAVQLTTTTPGQNAIFNFSGTTNQRISIVTSYTGFPGNFHSTLKKPDGAIILGPSVWSFSDVLVLDQTGTYSLLIDPVNVPTTGTVTGQLYEVPADASATLVAGGSAVQLTTTAPGQNAIFTFSGSTNQRISLQTSYTGFPSNFQSTLKNPDGSIIMGPSVWSWTDLLVLQQTGTYSLFINPLDPSTGTVTAQLYEVPPDASGTLVINGPSVPLTVSTPGQNAVFSFEGVTSDALTLTLSSSLSQGHFLSVKNPDGSYLWGPAGGSPLSASFTLTQSGTHTILVDAYLSGTGGVTGTLARSGGALPIEVASDGVPTHGKPAARVTDAEAPSRSFSPPRDDREWVPDASSRRNWRTGRADSPWRSLPPLQAPAGVTAVSGQVLALNGAPLSDIAITLGDRETTTDANGQFLISEVTAGHHELIVDGGLARVRNARPHGIFPIGIDVIAGGTNVLPFTIWLPVIDLANAVQVSAPTTQEVVLTTPRIPGLEVRIPAGTRITDEDGEPVTELSITAIPIDRPPYPLPGLQEIPVYFTVQPGGAYLSRKARVIYPNYTDLPAGTRQNFWFYDPEDRGWYVYGQGEVSADGRQVVPDPGVGIYEFTGAMFGGSQNPPDIGTAIGNFFFGGDPVDLGTGLFVLDKTDLALPDVSPISLTRTYRQNDPYPRPFGIGASHPYAVSLWSAQPYQEVDLVLPDGSRVHYVRVSPGTGFGDAIFEHTSSPSSFYRSRIYWNGAGWTLWLRDGTKLFFIDNGPLRYIEDRFGNRTLIDRGSNPWGNMLTLRSPNGRWIAFSYDGSNRITQAKDNTGRTVGYTYNAAGYLWKVTDAAGQVTEYTYDANNRLRTIKDPRLITFLTVDYDANGRVQKQTQPDSTFFQFAYTLDQNGKVTQTDVTDPRGFVRRVTFNAAGYGVSDTVGVGQPEAQTTTYSRDPASNQVLTATDALSRVTRNTYDAWGSLLTITSLYGTPDALTTTFTYEPGFREIASVTDPLGHPTTFGYDARGNRTSETDALQHATSFGYNYFGQLTSATNALQKTTSFGYTAGDLVSITDPLGRVTRAFADAAGRPSAVTDPLGNQTRTSYDGLNRVTQVRDPRGGLTEFTYDQNGNRLTVKDAKLNVTTYTYDDFDRVATRRDALLRTETYAYDANGNLLTVTDRKNQVTEFRYDPLDRQTFAGFGRTGSPPNYSYQSTMSYTYDAGNRLTLTADTTSGNITRGYDLLDRLTSETTGQGNVTYQYDGAGRRTQLQIAGQTAVAYGYDNADRLLSITQGATVIGFGYDNADRRTSLTLPGNLEVVYGYDDASQLLALTYKRSGSTIGDLSYTYDAIGRRATTSGSYARLNLPAAVSSTIYNANNQLTKWGNTNLTYDFNGNMNGDGTNTYTWNSRDQLAAVTKTGQTLPSFTYDAFGRRQKKTLGATVTSYLYDGANSVQELVGASPSANLLSGLGVDELFQRVDANTRIALADALGSTLALADSSGVVQTSYTYAPYGATTVSGGASANPSKFTGREDDADGLYFYRARYYHPVMSRFVSEDPIGLASGDPNLYAYAADSPTNFSDPSGNCPICLIAFAAWVAYDAYDLLLSGRKHSSEERLWFIAGLTPVGKAAKLLRGAVLVANPRIAIAGLRGAKDPGHAITQIIHRGVKPIDVLVTIRNPAAVIHQANGRYLYLSSRAGVVIRPDGQIVTAWTSDAFRPEYVDLLRQIGAIQ